MTLFVADYGSVAVIQCSPPSWMAHMLLLEKAAVHRVVPLSFAKGEHRSESMLARNPRGTIPVLEHDGVCLYETFAILEYIDWVVAEPAFLPGEARARARALTRFHESENLKGKGMALFAYLMRTPPGERDDATMGDLRSAFDQELDRWESVTPGDGFAGELPSLADITVFAYLATALRLGLCLDTRPQLRAFYESFAAREAVRKAWPATWQSEGERPLS